MDASLGRHFYVPCLDCGLINYIHPLVRVDFEWYSDACDIDIINQTLDDTDDDFLFLFYRDLINSFVCHLNKDKTDFWHTCKVFSYDDDSKSYYLLETEIFIGKTVEVIFEHYMVIFEFF